MPPKRSQNVTATQAPKPAAKRRSKLAKEHGISAEVEAEIQEVWDMFRREEEGHDSKQGVIKVGDARRCLVALNAPPKDTAEWKELVEAMDVEDSGLVEYEHFYAIAAMKMNAKDNDPEAYQEEINTAYRLFTRGQDREININDLKRIAKELKEDVPDSVLRDMIREATEGGTAGVNLESFQDVMKRAGVFG